MMLPAVEQLNSNFGLLAGVGCIYSHAELKDKTKTQRENPFVSQSMENQLHQLQMKKKKKKIKIFPHFTYISNERYRIITPMDLPIDRFLSAVCLS